MARPKKDSERQRILLNAYKSFSEVGYDATSYSSLASRCNIAKSLLQYYFPRKEQLAIQMMDSLLHETSIFVKKNNPSLNNQPFAFLIATGQLFFEFLLQEGQYRLFLLDIIKNRETTQAVLIFDKQWALQAIGDTNHQQDLETTRIVTLQMGGFYEWLYYALRNDLPIDIGSELCIVVEEFMKVISTTDNETHDSLLKAKASEEDIRKMLNLLHENLAKTTLVPQEN